VTHIISGKYEVRLGEGVRKGGANSLAATEVSVSPRTNTSKEDPWISTSVRSLASLFGKITNRKAGSVALSATMSREHGIALSIAPLSRASLAHAFLVLGWGCPSKKEMRNLFVEGLGGSLMPSTR
jgi:hypothetical protein